MSNPADLKYSESHEWVRLEGDEAVVGVTDFAQDALGDVTYVEPPAEGSDVAAGVECGSIESVKAASDLVCPVTGKVCAVNGALENEPERVNRDPYGEGWIFRVAGAELPADLMDAAAYEAFCAKEAN